MTSWDAEGFDGSFGRRSWVELVPRDTWRLFVRVMDQDDAGEWVRLGAVLLLMPDGGEWAERAFRSALRLDESVAAQIEAAREAARDAQRRRDRQERAIEEQKLATADPEAADWPADPWPAQAPDERVAAMAAMQADARQILRGAGLQVEPLETEHFLVYADLPPIGTARLAARLEGAYREMARLLWVDPAGNQFWGKAVVLYLSDADRFRLVEAESFGQLVPRRTTAICHFDGPKVFIDLTGDVESEGFAPAVAHVAVHAFMHRYGSPARLPPWANEGLADHIASVLAADATTERQRKAGLDFIRGGGDVAALLATTYADGWPGPQQIGPALGTLLVELMIAQAPDRFGAWVRAVKAGADWRDALATDYGVPLPALLDTFLQYYRVND